MKVLITGCAGFIGSHLVDHLLKKKEIKKIIGIDNLEDGQLKNLEKSLKSKKFLFYKADLCKINGLTKIEDLFKKVDCIFHLAAYSDVVPSINYPKEYMSNNINSTLTILHLMKKFKIKKIIYAASSSCYGTPKLFPTNERERIDCKYPYSLSKNLCEQVISHWSKIYKFSYISLRLFNVYGTRSRTNSAYGAALGVFLKQKLSNKSFTIVGNGRQKRDFIFVKDVCQVFYLAAIKKIRNEVFNIGSGSPKSINYLVSLLGGRKIYIKKRPGEPDITHADISKARKLLGWYPKTSLEDGIKIVLENIEYWRNAPLWNKTKINNATKLWFKYLK